MLSYLDDRDNTQKQLIMIWAALHGARASKILKDGHWDDICTAMAWITEDLGINIPKEDELWRQMD